jgi:hypothetical protein
MGSVALAVGDTAAALVSLSGTITSAPGGITSYLPDTRKKERRNNEY